MYPGYPPVTELTVIAPSKPSKQLTSDTETEIVLELNVLVIVSMSIVSLATQPLSSITITL